MAAVVVSWIFRALSLAWLTGPIFDKEMRVSSRRRRNYVLRFLYIGLFMSLLALVWAETMPYQSGSVYLRSRMAAAGQAVVGTVLWFEFLTVQVIAIVMLSTSISDEIYHRTLGVLMTTPIGSFQIVLGKLLSKLLQLALLLAISLPLLAIVRVFGGVPWDFLVCGLCVTLTTAVFVGSLSLLFSIFTRRAYTVIIATILATGVLFGLMPALLSLLYHEDLPPDKLVIVLSYFNPYILMTIATESLYTAQATWGRIWPVHCVVMLGVSALLLLLAAVLVRRAALRQAMGQAGLWSGRPARDVQESAARGRVRRVIGPPVLWKECRIPLLGRRRLMNIIVATVTVGLLCLIYGLCYYAGILDDSETHVAYIMVYFAIGMLFTIVLPATCIASEKESQTWPLLLTTAIGEWEILASKFGGVLRRCVPAWALLFGHVAVAAALGVIHPIAIFQLAVLVAWVVIFLSGTGLYFGARLRHTTAAVIANMGVAAGLWAVGPLLLALLAELARLDDGWIEVFLDLNPFVHAGVIAMATTHKGRIAAYEWVQGGLSNVMDATLWIFLTAILYTAAATALAAWTGARMRRNLM